MQFIGELTGMKMLDSAVTKLPSAMIRKMETRKTWRRGNQRLQSCGYVFPTSELRATGSDVPGRF